MIAAENPEGAYICTVKGVVYIGRHGSADATLTNVLIFSNLNFTLHSFNLQTEACGIHVLCLWTVSCLLFGWPSQYFFFKHS